MRASFPSGRSTHPEEIRFPGLKPAHWTAGDRDYGTLRTGMRARFSHLGISAAAA